MPGYIIYQLNYNLEGGGMTQALVSWFVLLTPYVIPMCSPVWGEAFSILIQGCRSTNVWFKF